MPTLVSSHNTIAVLLWWS